MRLNATNKVEKQIAEHFVSAEYSSRKYEDADQENAISVTKKILQYMHKTL